MRLWARFSKQGDLKFLSHLDLVRTFERTLRRSGLDVTFTQGYNPHVKFAFASALPVGISSSGEYIDIFLNSYLSPTVALNKINSHLPEGLQLTQIKQVKYDYPSLMSLIRYAKYTIKMIKHLDQDEQDINKCISKMLDEQNLFINKKTKKGYKKINLKPLIISAVYNMNSFEVFLKAGSISNATPEQFIQALNEYTVLNIDNENVDIHREQLFIKLGTVYATPFDYQS